MEVKLERWGRLSESPRRVEETSDGRRSRGPGWRRSGDESYWESLVSAVEVIPQVPRPQSCIGGIGVEGWLQQLETAQGIAPACAKMPPLSDRTVSMPTLQGGAPFRHYPGRGRDRAPHRPVGRNETPPGSEEELLAPPGQWETARFRSAPRAQPVRISTLASVKNGWLPLQKRAAVCDVTCHAPPPKDSTCQDQHNPAITTQNPKCYIKKNGLEHTDAEEKDNSSKQANCMDPRTRRLSGQASPNIIQDSNLASLEGDSPLGRERWKKEWEARRTAFFSDGIQSGDNDGVARAAPRIHSPLHRTVSAPVPSRTAAPPAGVETLPTKPRFSSIMVSAKRIPRSQTSPSSSPTAKLDEAGSSAPPALVNHAGKPDVVRRRVSMIKVTDDGRNRCADETRPGVVTRQFRRSYAEGDEKEDAISRFWEQSRIVPAQPVEGQAGYAGAAPHPRRPRSFSLAEPERGGEKIYRSTLSLYLCSPASSGTAGGGSGAPRRPLSFAGAFRHAEPGLGGPPAPAAKQPSREPPEKANTGCAGDAACSLNTRPPSASQPGTGTSRPNSEPSKQDVGTCLGLGLHPGQSWSQPSAAIKPQESDTHQSAEAILALNAAAIIANIKLQARISKMASLLSEREKKELPETGNETVEDSGSHESCPPDGGVVRRAQGNAGRRGRPRPIHWQEPLSDQQEDNAAPLTVREALELLRPDFISRSQQRVKEVERRALKRRAQQRSTPELESAQGTRRTCRAEPRPFSDNHCKLGDRGIVGKEMVLRSKRANSSLPLIKSNRQEEKKKVTSQTNRLRAAVFKKKLLDQILQRNTD
ncbi:hypothetical protein SKAU_G00143500 [Synaphobranchus kaupii]|uniref:ALMS motif domain-containing protein n=1 Tax=Synaphobranchus kaupii TaxID=118154 RepID=A0A9Q1FT55_SYNKA|nr:hypothetical protein SKAU_G00143500 [Synaphobranchus kaupii]